MLKIKSPYRSKNGWRLIRVVALLLAFTLFCGELGTIGVARALTLPSGVSSTVSSVTSTVSSVKGGISSLQGLASKATSGVANLKSLTSGKFSFANLAKLAVGVVAVSSVIKLVQAKLSAAKQKVEDAKKAVADTKAKALDLQNKLLEDQKKDAAAKQAAAQKQTKLEAAKAKRETARQALVKADAALRAAGGTPDLVPIPPALGEGTTNTTGADTGTPDAGTQTTGADTDTTVAPTPSGPAKYLVSNFDFQPDAQKLRDSLTEASINELKTSAQALLDAATLPQVETKLNFVFTGARFVFFPGNVDCGAYEIKLQLADLPLSFGSTFVGSYYSNGVFELSSASEDGMGNTPCPTAEEDWMIYPDVAKKLMEKAIEEYLKHQTNPIQTAFINKSEQLVDRLLVENLKTDFLSVGISGRLLMADALADAQAAYNAAKQAFFTAQAEFEAAQAEATKQQEAAAKAAADLKAREEEQAKAQGDLAKATADLAASEEAKKKAQEEADKLAPYFEVELEAPFSRPPVPSVYADCKDFNKDSTDPYIINEWKNYTCKSETTKDTNQKVVEKGMLCTNKNTGIMWRCVIDETETVHWRQVIQGKEGGEILSKYAGMIYKWLAGFVGILSVLLLIAGGIQISIAGGAQSQLDSGKNRIIAALVGLALLFLSGLILYTINPTFFA